MSWCDKQAQRLDKHPGRKALGLGHVPGIHLEKQKNLWSRKGEGKKPQKECVRENKRGEILFLEKQEYIGEGMI